MPGYDVLTAGPGQLQFSSDFAQLSPRPYVDIDCNWNETGYREYDLPRAYPSPPLVHFQEVISGDEMREIGMGVCRFFWERIFQGGGQTQTARHVVNAYATETKMRIYSENASTSPSQVTPPNFRLRYTVMDYNL